MKIGNYISHKKIGKLRAYQYLKENNPNLLFNINNELSDCTNIGKASIVKPLNDLFDKDDYNKVINQFVYNKIGTIPLNSEILDSIATNRKISYPLPHIWKKIIEESGLSVNNLKSSLLWMKFVLFNFLSGISFIFLIFKFFFSKTLINDLSNSIHLFDANTAMVGTGREEELNFVNWLVNFFKKEKVNIELISHPANCKDFDIDNIKIKNRKKNWMPIPNTFRKKIVFSGWAFKVIFQAFGELLFLARWENALMMREIVKGKLFSLANKDQIYKAYFFSNSLFLYKPLWTYVAEKQNAEIILFFYATNTESFKSPGKYNSELVGWHSATWKTYYVWDRYRAAFLDRANSHHKEITIVGAIWFEDSCEILELPKKFNISLFDVTPFRITRYCELGIPSWNDYYINTTNKKFFTDIIEVTSELDCQLNWKSKRNYAYVHDRTYIASMKRMTENGMIHAINPSISAFRVIGGSNMVISMPFTSTALIASYYHIPTAYYDPLNMIDIRDRAAHGIQVITNKEDLKKWVINNYKT